MRSSSHIVAADRVECRLIVDRFDSDRERAVDEEVVGVAEDSIHTRICRGDRDRHLTERMQDRRVAERTGGISRVVVNCQVLHDVR